MNQLVKQIVESNYLLEADNQRLIDMQQKVQEKIIKAKEKVDKYQQKFNKLIDKYKQHTEYHQYVPVDVMSNFKYVPYMEIKDLESKLGRHLSFPNNYVAYDMYRDAYDNNAPKEILNSIYWEYICKLDEICESIHRAENELKDLEKRNAEYTLKINHKISMESLVEELFTKVPELKEFIDSCAEKQYEFLIKQNEALKKAWDRYNKAKEDKEENYRKLLPQRFIRTEEEISHEVKMWVKNESELLATRLTTEFGDIEHTSLYIGPDGNVNGYITGSKKSAKIETIFAGGYNIQCLHTRLLIHEISRNK